MRRIAIILGTRPEILKMSPIIRELEERELDFFILHTGQHYSLEMDKIFFEELELPKPKYNLGIGGQPYEKQVGLMMEGIIPILKKEKPGIVLVVGDTSSVLAGALAAKKLNIKVGHIESGLRSNDWMMLEEQHRVIVDHIADYLFAPTKEAEKNLYEEGISKEKIFLTGNTIVDAVYQNSNLAKHEKGIMEKLGLKNKNYILLTTHRAENVDIKERLKGILDGIRLIKKEFKIPIVFPIHPRTKLKVEEFGLKFPEIKIIKPVSFLQMLILEKEAKLVISDSGGIQEESCIMRIPHLTIRDNTERPETLKIGQNIIVGTNPKKILKGAKKMMDKQLKYKVCPFGDGKASLRIINLLNNRK